MNTQPYTLLTLNTLVSRRLQEQFPAAYWLTAELANVSVRGHLYGELVEKNEAGQTVASARCTCWQGRLQEVQRKFRMATGNSLRAGLKVMLCVQVTFHPQYGFAYNIIGIDPTYTIGDAARRRKEILDELQRQGLMRLNELNNPLPSLIQRIAVISSPTAAGYGDFIDQLLRNKQRLRFLPTLFAAVMQGQQVEESLLAALGGIARRRDEFDAVVIIRGGGSVTDLDCFDNYRLAEAVARFPLPVFTGIGHERDEVVLDFVAHTRLKTPTAVASFLVELGARQLERLERAATTIRNEAVLRLQREHSRMEAMPTTIRDRVALRLQRERSHIDGMVRSLPQSCLRRIDRQQHLIERLIARYSGALALTRQRHLSRLDLLEQKVRMLDPARVLERGYTMTLCDGRLVTAPDQAPSGATLITRTAGGEIKSRVER